MVKWPERVEITDQGLATLTTMLKTTYKEIVNEIYTATNFGVANRKVILAQIDKRLRSLGVDMNEFIKTEVPEYYQTGAKDAVDQLKEMNVKVPVKTGFNKVHNEALNALVSDTASSFGDAIQGVHRSAQRLLSTAVKQQITQDIASGIAKGETLKNVKKVIKGTLADEGLDSLVDKAGRAWTLDRYAEMLYRTKMAEARNLGMVNRMAENGYDLVQVSSHGAIDVCGKWEGKILSTTGATSGYPTVDDAMQDGLFHPNCRHAINAIVPDLMAEVRAYNKTTGAYDDSPHTQVNIMVNKASKYNGKFTEKIQTLADNNDWVAKIAPVKKEERALQKVVNDYGFQANQLKDVNRSVLLIGDPSQVNDVIGQIKKEFTVTRVKNDFANSNSGYKKIIVNVETPAGTAEIQLTTKEFWDAKQAQGGDALYNKVRIQADDWEKAKEQMDKLYADAAKALDKRLNSD